MAPKRATIPLLTPLIEPINKEDVFLENSHGFMPYELEISDLFDSDNANQMDETQFAHVSLSLISF